MDARRSTTRSTSCGCRSTATGACRRRVVNLHEFIDQQSRLRRERGMRCAAVRCQQLLAHGMARQGRARHQAEHDAKQVRAGAAEGGGQRHRQEARDAWQLIDEHERSREAELLRPHPGASRQGGARHSHGRAASGRRGLARADADLRRHRRRRAAASNLAASVRR